MGLSKFDSFIIIKIIIDHLLCQKDTGDSMVPDSAQAAMTKCLQPTEIDLSQ